MSECVLDASALIAFLRREPGGAAVASSFAEAVISTVNLTEVVTRMIDEGFSPGRAAEVVAQTTVETIPFDEGLALEAGFLRRATRHLGLSLGDRACLALAARLGVPALTADRRWAELEVGVEVRLIRS